MRYGNYDPDYQEPKEICLLTPQLVNAMIEGYIKAVVNMGEDLTHIHPNLDVDFTSEKVVLITELAIDVMNSS